MKLFKRRQKNINAGLPPEIQAYSQAEHRERMGMAWLVGVISLLITVSVLLGLYFGGRWVYRKIAGENNTTSQITDMTEEEKKAKQDKEAENSEDSSKSDTTKTTEVPATPAQTPAQTTTPATGETLVRTGPDSDE